MLLAGKQQRAEIQKRVADEKSGKKKTSTNKWLQLAVNEELRTRAEKAEVAEKAAMETGVARVLH